MYSHRYREPFYLLWLGACLCWRLSSVTLWLPYAPPCRSGLSTKRPWLLVADYVTTVCTKRFGRASGRDWAVEDPSALRLLFDASSVASSSGTRSAAPARSIKGKYSLLDQACFSWNSGKCEFELGKCPRKYICRDCGDDHKSISCKATAFLWEAVRAWSTLCHTAAIPRLGLLLPGPARCSAFV